MILKNCIEQNAREDCKNNENLFTRKCYELSNDMFLQIEKYDDKVNYIQWSIATF